MRRRPALALAGVASVAVLAFALPNAAAAATRAEWAVAADAICKRSADTQFRLLKRDVRRLPRARGFRDFMRREALYDFRASKAIMQSVRGIAALPLPAGDELVIGQWLDSLYWDGVNAREAGRLARRKHLSFGRYFKEIEQAGNHSRATDLLADGLGLRRCASNTHYSKAVSASGLP